MVFQFLPNSDDGSTESMARLGRDVIAAPNHMLAIISSSLDWYVNSEEQNHLYCQLFENLSTKRSQISCTTIWK